jgi:hypothetical protein
MPTDDTFDVVSRAQALLREGKVQEADDLLSAQTAKLAAAGAAGTAPPPPPPPPPEPTWYNYALLAEQLFESVIATLASVFAHVGNPPSGQALLRQLRLQHQQLHDVRPGKDAPAPEDK